jgi:hypothetical protein
MKLIANSNYTWCVFDFGRLKFMETIAKSFVEINRLIFS